VLSKEKGQGFDKKVERGIEEKKKNIKNRNITKAVVKKATYRNNINRHRI
jgi:hypothetical protein